MTTPSQTIQLTVNINRRVAEHGARAVGFLAVALPCVILAKGFFGAAEPVTHPLPLLPHVETHSTYRPIDDRELDCLAANIFYESRNQPALGQLAVGITTYVRAKSENWPDSICGVVHQPKQFSWVTETKQSQRISSEDFSYLQSLELASNILAGHYDNLLPLFAPTHFHTTQVNPKWSHHLEKLARIDDHIFYE